MGKIGIWGKQVLPNRPGATTFNPVLQPPEVKFMIAYAIMVRKALVSLRYGCRGAVSQVFGSVSMRQLTQLESKKKKKKREAV